MNVADAQAVMNTKYWGYFRIARAAKISPTGSLTFIGGKLAARPTQGTGADRLHQFGDRRYDARPCGRSFADTRQHDLAGRHRYAVMGSDGAGRPRGDVQKSVGDLPARRIGQPEDVAQALVFLMTNPFATGMVMNLEGGALLL